MRQIEQISFATSESSPTFIGHYHKTSFQRSFLIILCTFVFGFSASFYTYYSSENAEEREIQSQFENIVESLLSCMRYGAANEPNIKFVGHEHENIDITIQDTSFPMDQALRYQSMLSPPFVKWDFPSWTIRKQLAIADQNLHVTFHPTVQFISQRKTSRSQVLLLTGLIFTFLLVTFLAYRLFRSIQTEQLLEALSEANLELRTLDHMKTHFLATVSHELRTPLSSIKGYTELMAKGISGPITKEQKYQLEINLRNTNNLMSMIDQLLEFSRFELENVVLNFESFDVGELCDEVISLFEIDFQKKGIFYKNFKPKDPITLEADRKKIFRVFTNLIENAIKFSEKDGKIGIEFATDGEETLWLSVEDTGIGIPDRFKEKVFTKFFQADSSLSKKHGGAGIGLALCKEIVQAHGGDIYVVSAIERGSTFFIKLPLIASIK